MNPGGRGSISCTTDWLGKMSRWKMSIQKIRACSMVPLQQTPTDIATS